MQFPHTLILVIVPTTLFLLAGCTTAPADVLSKAADIQANATARVEEIQRGVTNVVAGVEQARDDLLEKKRQLEQAVADVNTAINSVDTLLGKKGATTTETTATDLETQKKALEATLAEAQKALAEIEAKSATAK